MQKVILIFVVLVVMLGGILISQKLIVPAPEMALYLTIGLTLGLVAFFRPDVGLILILLTAFFIPEVRLGMATSGLTMAKRGIGIRPEDILTVFAATGWMVRLIIRKESILIPQTSVNAPIIILSFMMVLASLLGVLFGSVSFATSLFYTLKRLEYFFIYFMVLTVVQTPRQIKSCVTIFLVVSGAVALWGLVQYINLPTGRVTGPGGGDANTLAGFLLIPTFLTLNFLFKTPSKNLKFGLLILLLLSIYVLSFTRSRSGYTALYIGFIFYSLMSRRLYLLTIAALLIYLMPVFFPADIERQAHTIIGVFNREIGNPSWEARVAAWVDDGIPKIIKQPFFGYGLGAHDLAWFDNQYVTDALSMGLIGLGIFIWLMIRLFRSGWKIYRESSEPFNQTLALGYLGGLVALLIQGIGISNFYTIRTMVPFWFLTGLVMAAGHLEEEKKGGISAERVDTT